MSPVPQHLRDQLIVLLAKQLCFLEKETFGVVTESEILDYEYRQEYIHELCKQLLASEIIKAAYFFQNEDLIAREGACAPQSGKGGSTCPRPKS